MLNRIILVEPTLAQTPPKPKTSPQSGSSPPTLWMGLTLVFALALVGGGIFAKLQVDKFAKKAKFEEFKNHELQKKLKLALATITKMETNPDLVHSREFNLDYLRMRMEEEVFHFAIVNQIKVKVKERIAVALRPTQAKEGKINANATGRQVSETFDVEYEPGDGPKGVKRVLFRIQINLTKLPTQATSQTISQIIDCMETYLSPTADHDTWQPTIQGRIVNMHWDQKAKPTPLLVLEQLNEGVNVTFRTNRQPPPLPPKPPTKESSKSSKTSSGSSSQKGANPTQGKSKGQSSRPSRSGKS